MLTQLKRTVHSARRRRTSCPLAVQIEQLEPLQLLAHGPISVIHPGPPSPSPIINPYSVPEVGADDPQQIADAYGFNQISFPNNPLLGAGQTIAIIEIGIDPNITSDANTFNTEYGLPQLNSSNFLIYNAPDAQNDSPSDGHASEEALDVEWAHAMAPGANILLVHEGSHALDQFTYDLDHGVNYAANWPGVSVVSISYDGTEYQSESNDDQYYTTPYFHNPVAFVSSSGDSRQAAPGTEYPSVSPEVLSVGGTVFTKALGNSGQHQIEDAWKYSAGGTSPYESELVYNSQGQLVESGPRQTPDVAYNAQNYSIFDSYDRSGWSDIGGTSAAAPQWAALVAIADQGRALQGLATLDNLPSQINAIGNPASPNYDPNAFHDIQAGKNVIDGLSAGPGYDLVTGYGSPRAQVIVQDLINSTYQAENPSYGNGNPLLYQGGPGPINPHPPTRNPGSGPPEPIPPLGDRFVVENRFSSLVDDNAFATAETMGNANDALLTAAGSGNESTSWSGMAAQSTSVANRSSVQLSGTVTPSALVDGSTSSNYGPNAAEADLWAGLQEALEILGGRG